MSHAHIPHAAKTKTEIQGLMKFLQIFDDTIKIIRSWQVPYLPKKLAKNQLVRPSQSKIGNI